MERIIKFKAKTIIDGSWVYGDLLQHIDGTTLIGDNQGEFTDDGYGHLDYHNVYKVDPSTVCQYTGVKDKNGNNIWEHDIIEEVWTLPHRLHEVIYIPHDGAFAFKNLDNEDDIQPYCNLTEFISLGSKFDRNN